MNARIVVAVSALLTSCASPSVQATRPSENGTAALQVGALATRENVARIDWLKQHAAPIRSIDPADENFDDLAPLGRAIGNARVVFLGEAGHGEGSSILGRTRLVKYLHQKLGFDVLVWESGFYEGPKVWDALLTGSDPVAALGKGMLPAWSWSGEIEPLARYLAAEARSTHPLYYTGFDPNLSARSSIASRVAELHAMVESAGLHDMFANDSLFWRGLSWTILSKDSLATDSASVAQFGARAALLGRLLASKLRTPESRFWQQLLESAAANATVQQLTRLEMNGKGNAGWASSNIRDEQGAKNLLWLANDRYRGHKLIVWSATVHAARHVGTVDTRDTALSYTGYRPTGDHVWNAMGKQMYALGVVALTGSSRLGNDSWPIKQDQHPDAELEELMGAAGFNAAFLDYRHVARGGAWLRAPMLSRAFAQHAKIARWDEVLDGIVFLREMKPATWPNFEARLKGTPGSH